MAYRNFIRLRSDDTPTSTYDFLFKVIVGSWKPMLTRTQTRRRTLTGKADTAEGAVIYGYNGTILCSASLRAGLTTLMVDNNGAPVTVSGTAYNLGTLNDLQNIFLLNNPAGVPSSRLWFYDFSTDFPGNYNSASPAPPAVYVEFVGQFSPDALSPAMYGEEAQFYVPLSFEKVN